MPKLSGQCLCNNVRFSADTDIKMAANCHCQDCRAATGAAYATLLFVDEADVKIDGNVKVFKHTADSGAAMEKLFCPDCGSQLFGRNANRAGLLSVRAGVLNELDLIKPAVNVYASSKIPSTPLDPDLKSFDKMPG